MRSQGRPPAVGAAAAYSTSCVGPHCCLAAAPPRSLAASRVPGSSGPGLMRGRRAAWGLLAAGRVRGGRGRLGGRARGHNGEDTALWPPPPLLMCWCCALQPRGGEKRRPSPGSSDPGRLPHLMHHQVLACARLRARWPVLAVRHPRPLAGVCARTNRAHDRRGLLTVQLAGPCAPDAHRLPYVSQGKHMCYKVSI